MTVSVRGITVAAAGLPMVETGDGLVRVPVHFDTEDDGALLGEFVITRGEAALLYGWLGRRLAGRPVPPGSAFAARHENLDDRGNAR